MRFSIIIPVYNAAQYLEKCLDSILAQTYQNFELLLVDDGSRDGSSAICDRYASMDCRIKVFHKSNGGASSARNYGIERSKGQYLVFIDADDYVGLDYLEQFSKHDADCVLCGIKDFDGIDRLEIPNQQHSYQKSDIVNFVNDELWASYIRGPYAKAIRRNVIIYNSIRFNPKIRFGEDALFCIECYFNCKDIQTLKSVGYYYKTDSNIFAKYHVSGNEYLEYLLNLHAICTKHGVAEDFKGGMRKLIAIERVTYKQLYLRDNFRKSIGESYKYISKRIYSYELYDSWLDKIKACTDIITLPYRRWIYSNVTSKFK